MTASLSVGDTAPEFALTDHSGAMVALSDFRGKRVVLYFYPKDFTPGCTQEACDFRDAISAGDFKADAVIGVSPDSPEKHAEFAKQYELPFTLLSDPDRSVMKTYGAYGEKQNYGRTVVGVIRSTFVISPDQTIEKIYLGIRAKGHAKRVADALA